uniref:Orf75 n=1 Tax=Lactococcus phage phi31.1 TaxID=117830 RepID=Q9MCF9_9CAUD|nr:Orf75 [Lactococcus phage phi31.1]
MDSNNLASLLDEWYCHHEDMSSHIREYFERLPYKGPNNLSEMENNIVTFITRAKLGGYKLEKPQLLYIALPKVYG